MPWILLYCTVLALQCCIFLLFVTYDLLLNLASWMMICCHSGCYRHCNFVLATFNSCCLAAWCCWFRFSAVVHFICFPCILIVHCMVIDANTCSIDIAIINYRQSAAHLMSPHAQTNRNNIKQIEVKKKRANLHLFTNIRECTRSYYGIEGSLVMQHQLKSYGSLLAKTPPSTETENPENNSGRSATITQRNINHTQIW